MIEKTTYIQLAEEGQSYEEIKKAAQNAGITGYALRELMREVDDIILAKGEERSKRGHAAEWMLVGACIFLISTVMLGGSFIDPNSNYIYLVYAGLLGGGTVFIAGRRFRS